MREGVVWSPPVHEAKSFRGASKRQPRLSTKVPCAHYISKIPCIYISYMSLLLFDAISIAVHDLGLTQQLEIRLLEHCCREVSRGGWDLLGYCFYPYFKSTLH